ncbi:hypothetical protein RBSH_02717 [Rhodopirellula baltica SH28]|uniref:Dihydrodipicolinate synthase family protein n=1 Tax=Rhodopirellula baltica SH28 TaxID=993517 RepID=K5E820_RHOBT|nr:hypothetical protein [Rhodopirellula baltica]EKK01951.1 hypothetical protein RBSH_02717 [Rhodopirellula baltica SH28]
MNTTTLPELTSAPQPIRNRKITGMSAILLPMTSSGEIDWIGFESHVVATLDAGLTPAINMDTGYANLISDGIREEALVRTSAIAKDRAYLGGVFVGDRSGDDFNSDAYRRGINQVQGHDGTPILFQSFGLTGGDDDSIFNAYSQLASECEQFYAFELGTMFAPFGKIYSLSLYERLMGIGNCLGGEAFIARSHPGMAAFRTSKSSPPGLQGSDRKRLGNRHGDVRQRLLVGIVNVLPSRVRAA